MTVKGEPASSLRTHEADAAGEPVCGQRLRPWKGQTMVWTPQGSAVVDCRRCLSVHMAQP